MFFFCDLCALTDPPAAANLAVYNARQLSLGGFGSRTPAGYEGQAMGGASPSFGTPPGFVMGSAPEIAPGETFQAVRFLEISPVQSRLVALESLLNLVPDDGTSIMAAPDFDRTSELIGNSTEWSMISVARSFRLIVKEPFSLLGEEAYGFPVGTTLPLGLFLCPSFNLLNHPLALAEYLMRQAEELLQDNVGSFMAGVEESFLQLLALEDDGTMDEAETLARHARIMAEAPRVRIYTAKELKLRFQALGLALRSAVQTLWTEDMRDTEVGVVLTLPFPSISSALGKFSSIENVERLAALFSVEPAEANDVVGFWRVCAKLQDELTACGVKEREPAELASKA